MQLISKGAADTEQFDMAFAGALSEAGFPDAELETARVMRHYLRSVSLSMHSYVPLQCPYTHRHTHTQGTHIRIEYHNTDLRSPVH